MQTNEGRGQFFREKADILKANLFLNPPMYLLQFTSNQ